MVGGSASSGVTYFVGCVVGFPFACELLRLGYSAWESCRTAERIGRSAEGAGPKHREFSVELTMQQVKDSPDIDTDRPVSRQIETNIYDYYGWSPYWGNGLFTDSYDYIGDAVAVAPSLGSRQPLASRDLCRPWGSWQREEAIADTERSDDDPHLRSIETVTGYHIHASDGEIGHIEDFLVDDADWSIHYLVVNTKNWWPGRS